MKRKLLLTILSFLLLASLSMSVACKDSGNAIEPEVKFIPSEIVYRVGDSINCYEMIETKFGVQYSFTVAQDGEEAKVIDGQTFYASVSGDYTISCTAIAGKKTVTETQKITVYDNIPFVMIESTESKAYNYKFNLGGFLPTKYTILSDSEYQLIYTGVTVYKNEHVYGYYTAGEEMTEEIKKDLTFYDLTTGTPSEDGLYDASNDRVICKYEGFYVFDVLVRNAGGEIQTNLIVKISENMNNYLEYDGNAELEYDYYAENNEEASWNEVPNAANYRVKMGYENIILDSSNSREEGGKIYFKLQNYLSTKYTHFQNFDLYVIPLDANGEAMKRNNQPLKITLEDVSITPVNQKYAVFSKGATAKYNEAKDIATATLTGVMAAGFGRTDFGNKDVSYVAWDKDFGLGYYVDFTFTGNNIPNVCFFADKLNGCMSSGDVTAPSKGLLVLSGAYGVFKSGGDYRTLFSDSLLVWGPNRVNGGFNANAHEKGIWDSFLTRLTGDKFTECTQDYLKADRSGKTYQYTIGTFNQGDYISLDIRLYDISGANKVELVNEQVSTNIHISQLTSGKIIAYAPLKEVDGAAGESSFTFTTPYQSQPTQKDNDGLVVSGATLDKTNKIATLDGNGLDAINGKSFASYFEKLSNPYIAWEGDYGVGYYVDFEFKGNNMPQMCFFADKINGSMIGYTVTENTKDAKATKALDKVNKGLLLTNGLYSADALNHEDLFNSAVDIFRIWGPNRINPSDIAQYQKDLTGYLYQYKSGDSTDGKDLFTQGGVLGSIVKKGLTSAENKDVNYKYVVGTCDVNGEIYVDAKLYNKDTGMLLASIYENTGLKTADNYTGSIIAYATVKGHNRYRNLTDTQTVFKYGTPYSK